MADMTAGSEGEQLSYEAAREELVETVSAVPGVDVAVGSVAGVATMVNPETGDPIGSLWYTVVCFAVAGLSLAAVLTTSHGAKPANHSTSMSANIAGPPTPALFTR